MSPKRHADMEIVRKRLLEEYKVFCQNLQYIQPDTEYFTLLSDRFTIQPVLRGYYLDLINRYIENEAHAPVSLPLEVKTTVLPFVAEVLMTVMYYDNQILDRKAGITTDEKRNHNLLQSGMLLSELYHYVETRVKDELVMFKIQKLIREVYEIVCIGQEIEIRHNHFDAWEQNKFAITGYKNLPFNETALQLIRNSILEATDFPENKRDFVDAYSRRIYLTNACLFAHFTKFLTDRSSLPEQVQKNIFEYVGLVGIVFQMVNDITDLIPEKYNPGTKTKDATDGFSDFKNGNITLPIAIHLCSAKKLYAYNLLKNKPLHGKKCIFFNDHALCEDMLSSGAIKKAKEIVRSIKTNILSNLNKDNNAFSFLKDCMDIANHNKFYGILEKIEKSIHQEPETSSPRGAKIYAAEKVRQHLHMRNKNKHRVHQKATCVVA